ncbi:MAG: alpha-ketoglutarate-dependent dioxygenase AlkB [Hyphomicrobiales bacterium]|nr:MAG: alpha-ketoglutarate-dependent dioxygenase AlkB [Hyphomicrobiales bacterium]
MERERLIENLRKAGHEAHSWSEGESWVLFVKDYAEGFDFARLDEDIAWRQDHIRMFGRSIALPRRTAWYGDPGANYVYSGIKNEALPWTSLLQNLLDRLRNDLGREWNSVLANRYADGDQHQGYHADDEKELGDRPLIASLSFGATRRFLVKKRSGDAKAEVFDLDDKSLLLMGGRLQEDYVHALAKTKKAVGARINLTFRQIYF